MSLPSLPWMLVWKMPKLAITILPVGFAVN